LRSSRRQRWVRITVHWDHSRVPIILTLRSPTIRRGNQTSQLSYAVAQNVSASNSSEEKQHPSLFKTGLTVQLVIMNLTRREFASIATRFGDYPKGFLQFSVWYPKLACHREEPSVPMIDIMDDRGESASSTAILDNNQTPPGKISHDLRWE
jgi:hypothetical protein